MKYPRIIGPSRKPRSKAIEYMPDPNPLISGGRVASAKSCIAGTHNPTPAPKRIAGMMKYGGRYRKFSEMYPINMRISPREAMGIDPCLSATRPLTALVNMLTPP